MNTINYSFENHTFENILMHTINFTNMLNNEIDIESSKYEALQIVLQMLYKEIYLRVLNASMFEN